jgi:hypothetical protein
MATNEKIKENYDKHSVFHIKEVGDEIDYAEERRMKNDGFWFFGRKDGYTIYKHHSTFPTPIEVLQKAKELYGTK